DEEWGAQTHYDYGFRIYNPSIARFLSVDPLAPDYPMLTPYQYASNAPATFIDLDGLEGVFPEADPSDQGVSVILEGQELVLDGTGGYLLKKTFSILHNTPSGDCLTVPYCINQTLNDDFDNWDYLLEFTLEHPQEAVQASVLANVLDPASSYSGFFKNASGVDYLRDYASEKRETSVVGIFISSIETRPIGDQGKNNFFGKVFRHQVYSGMLSSIYGSEMGTMIGDFNEMGNQGDFNVFKLNLGSLGAGDLLNNAWGAHHMDTFMKENEGINNITDFTSYLNFVASKITTYSGDDFRELNSTSVHFTSDMQGVIDLYDSFKMLSDLNNEK
ncbi:MAG: RHS repeat-associated core domain-containing protein, partial [Bacteroidota bacterium]